MQPQWKCFLPSVSGKKLECVLRKCWTSDKLGHEKCNDDEKIFSDSETVHNSVTSPFLGLTSSVSVTNSSNHFKLHFM